MDIQEAIKEMESLSPSETAIEIILKELDKKDKIINDMANSIYLLDTMSEYGNSRDEVIYYFTNKYEE